MPLTRQNITVFVREIVGLGVALAADERTGLIRITTVGPKSPAGEAGLSAGHLIRSVNGVSLGGKTVQDCRALMGGPVGAEVRLELFDPERKETNTVELARQKFVTSSQ